jgi:hypothetical protein
MQAKPKYKIIRVLGEESTKGNPAFDQLEQLVNEHIHEGWRPLGGISISAVTAPKTVGSTRNNWFTCVAQGLVRETEE